MNIKLQTIFFVFFALFAFLGFLWAFKTETRLKRFFLGKKGKDLEDTLINLENKIKKLEEAKIASEKEITLINQKLRKSIRGLETVRFNPFRDQGSNQSFAIGMLDENGDGVVLSSLYSRERMSVFAKPVKNGIAEYELTKEEKEALSKAKVG